VIKFPTIHIATSVTNRILNAMRDIEAEDAPTAPGDQPSVPNAGPLGAALDASIAAPVGAVAPTDDALTTDLTVGALFP